MELIRDFSFQKWTQQCLGRVFPLGERCVCVFYIHHLFIVVTQVMGRCGQVSGLQLTDVTREKDALITSSQTINVIQISSATHFLIFFLLTLLQLSYLSVGLR